MTEQTATNQTQGADVPESTVGQSGAQIGPSEEERTRLIRALQSQALLGMNAPLAANVQMLCGDLAAFAADIRRSMSDDKTNGLKSAAGMKAFERKMDLFLRLSRQFDRFAHIWQKLASQEGED